MIHLAVIHKVRKMENLKRVDGSIKPLICLLLLLSQSCLNPVWLVGWVSDPSEPTAKLPRLHRNILMMNDDDDPSPITLHDSIKPAGLAHRGVTKFESSSADGL